MNIKIKLNGVILTLKQFEEKKKEIENQKGIKLIEVAPNEYKTKFYD